MRVAITFGRQPLVKFKQEQKSGGGKGEFNSVDEHSLNSPALLLLCELDKRLSWKLKTENCNRHSARNTAVAMTSTNTMIQPTVNPPRSSR